MQSGDKGQQIALQSRDKDATNAQVALACANLVPGYDFLFSFTSVLSFSAGDLSYALSSLVD